MSGSLAKWNRRIARADELAAALPFAAEALSFYAGIAGFQKSLYASLEGRAGSFRDSLDLSLLLPRFPPFLSLIERIAPPPLARSAAELSADRSSVILEEFWQAGERLTDAEVLISWTFLQPYAEHLADQAGPAETQASPAPRPVSSQASPGRWVRR